MSSNEGKEKDSKDDKDKVWVPPSVRHNMTETEKRQKQLDRMFENIDKPVTIPERKTGDKKDAKSRDFVRNVPGSSAGAGSGDFHVYRAIRRREYARLHQMDAEERREKLDHAFETEMERKKREDEERTAKKRARRQKRKQGKPANDDAANKKQKV
ncbi:hypothetical protein BC940DRAFT_316234 [Gongronella butleri]|nr:hypothetical protein BC940DRAFT_316234 [Gongronella butleri]